MTVLHERTQIRQAVVAALIDQTDAGSRVQSTRKAPVRSQEFPAICVYTDAEQTDEESSDSAPRWLKRTIQIAVEGWVRVDDIDAMDDALDALALQIETAMDADDSLGDTVGWQWPASTDIGVDLKGDKPIGCVKIVYTAMYHSDLRTSVQDAARPTFETADTKFNIDDAQAPADQAEDTVPIS